MKTYQRVLRTDLGVHVDNEHDEALPIGVATRERTDWLTLKQAEVFAAFLLEGIDGMWR